MAKLTTFEQVRTGIATYGDLAAVITVGDDGRPHVSSSRVVVGDDRLIAEVGARSRGFLEQRPQMTLVWHPNAGDEYQLIIDGTAASFGDPSDDGVSTVSIDVDGGIQHRLAGLDGDAPTCRPVDA